MPVVITCTECQAKLRSPVPYPVGKSLTCPKCKQSFTLSTENMQEVKENTTISKPAQDPAKANTDSRTGKSLPNESKPLTKTAPKVKEAPPATDDDENSESTRSKPSKKSVPSSESDSEIEDNFDVEDDRPKARKKGRVQDDEDDEDDDDRPKGAKESQKKKGKKQEGMSKDVKVGLIFTGIFLLTIIIVVLIN